MAKPELGTKRQCLSCGAKFYDLGKDPITCPRCSAVFQPSMLMRARPEPKRVEEDEEVEVDAAGPELVSLEDVEAEESGKDTAIEGVEIEDDIVADDDFLEEEEEGDDDVSDLIDGDIEDDEEA